MKRHKARGGSTGDSLLGIAFLGTMAALIWWILPDTITTEIWYSYKYDIPHNRVHFAGKPKTCDWEHAPIGDKACHYKKTVWQVTDKDGAVTDVYIGWDKVED